MSLVDTASVNKSAAVKAVQGAFPQLDRALIIGALQKCFYDVERAVKLLRQAQKIAQSKLRVKPPKRAVPVEPAEPPARASARPRRKRRKATASTQELQLRQGDLTPLEMVSALRDMFPRADPGHITRVLAGTSYNIEAAMLVLSGSVKVAGWGPYDRNDEEEEEEGLATEVSSEFDRESTPAAVEVHLVAPEETLAPFKKRLKAFPQPPASPAGRITVPIESAEALPTRDRRNKRKGKPQKRAHASLL
eukprot:TRINITY_DN23107_c0_g1_i1.p1 TRINITY_DN23107_c0_g1~~TRINITY_DN23107_c0_g1_i1.p1  ORF type:complete len:249 (+),score=-12.86 TRINITY_DN23107_c0_g1_i1:1-747(+)